jgi:23S rRNA (uracil1939-C5)-methyltransferase
VAETVRIDRLGQRGDGVADTPSGPVHVPLALPGETVTVDREGDAARLVAIDVPSPERAEPPCPLFGRCGGCAAQHMGASLYEGWKRDMVVSALRRARLDAPVSPLVRAHGDGRRRVTFHARRGEHGVAVGFMAARSHQLVEVDACPVLAPSLAGAPEAARIVAAALMGSGKPLDVQVTATANGLDMDVRGHGPASPRIRAALVAAAGRADLARLSLHGELIVERRPALVQAGPATVLLPPGAFLQATAAAEETLARLSADALSGAKKVADLFCGIGPFALRLAGKATVTAFDGDAPAIAALQRAVRETHGLRPVTAEARDLFRRPLLTAELAAFDGVVMDPPRAGAEAQSRQLASSKVPVVASVSCSAQTFARDAAILVHGGYRLESVVPVDQFLYAAHVEIVGVFRRPSTRRRAGLLG